MLSCVNLMYLGIYLELVLVSYHEQYKGKNILRREGKISKLGNNFLHESLLLQPITILIIFFCNLKILILSGEFPQNNKP